MSPTYRLRIPGFVLAFAAIVFGSNSINGQEAKPKDPLFRGRLPPYYGEIVTETQRQQIYAIQEKYDKQLSALEEQLEALKKKRDIEIVAVLSEEQRSKLKRAQDEATTKRKKTAEKRAADTKTAVK